MPDYIVTEVVSYRVDDVADEEEAIQAIIDAEPVDRDIMFEDCLDRTAACITADNPKPTPVY